MDALEIALRSLGLERGAKVLTTPFSAFATTLAILRAGGVPVFVDVDDNGNIDLT
jgi:dTDP-3-amino-3,4,6-trideoxy-alpha-D-glucose transaminase